MSEFRQNFITKEWVIVATERARPLHEFQNRKEKPARAAAPSGDCPFCPGNESMTAEESYRSGNTAEWRIRVVRNKYAALRPDFPAWREHNGKFLKSPGYGFAEVVIESPRHQETLDQLPRDHLEEFLRALLARFQDMSSQAGISLITMFKNQGAGAGTSIAHPHSQIIATPIIPPHVRDPFQKAMMHFDTYGQCGYCDMLEEERRQETRIVYENDGFVAFCPYASRTPFEVRILPKRHAASYAWISSAETTHFADALSVTVRKINTCLASPDYNFIIRSSPIGDEDVRYLHWYFLLVPKTTTPAGFEIGTGIYINTIPPETCAAILRQEQI